MASGSDSDVDVNVDIDIDYSRAMYYDPSKSQITCTLWLPNESSETQPPPPPPLQQRQDYILPIGCFPVARTTQLYVERATMAATGDVETAAARDKKWVANGFELTEPPSKRRKKAPRESSGEAEEEEEEEEDKTSSPKKKMDQCFLSFRQIGTDLQQKTSFTFVRGIVGSWASSADTVKMCWGITDSIWNRILGAATGFTMERMMTLVIHRLQVEHIDLVIQSEILFPRLGSSQRAVLSTQHFRLLRNPLEMPRRSRPPRRAKRPLPQEIVEVEEQPIARILPLYLLPLVFVEIAYDLRSTAWVADHHPINLAHRLLSAMDAVIQEFDNFRVENAALIATSPEEMAGYAKLHEMTLGSLSDALKMVTRLYSICDTAPRLAEEAKFKAAATHQLGELCLEIKRIMDRTTQRHLFEAADNTTMADALSVGDGGYSTKTRHWNVAMHD